MEEKSSEIDPVLHCKEICEQKYIAATQAGVQGKILVADTIVVSNNEILGKPKSREDAIRMLTSMSGSSHQVITGVIIGEKDGESKWLYESTEVVFQYNQKTIERYLDHNTYQDMPEVMPSKVIIVFLLKKSKAVTQMLLVFLLKFYETNCLI